MDRWQGSVGGSCGQDYGGGAGGVPGCDRRQAHSYSSHRSEETSVELVPFRNADSCLRASKCGLVSTVSTVVSPYPPSCNPATRASDHHATAATRVPTATPKQSEELALHYVAPIWETLCCTISVSPLSTGAIFSRRRRIYM